MPVIAAAQGLRIGYGSLIKVTSVSPTTRPESSDSLPTDDR
jgi:hypothetical protein